MSMLKDYEPVANRITKFWQKYPAGRIHTEIVLINEKEVVIKASIYTDREDPRPAANDFAQESVGSSNVNKTSWVENCATSAIGRALSALGFTTSKKNGEIVRASREEMLKSSASDRNHLVEASVAAGNGDIETLRVIYAAAVKSQVDNETLMAIKELADSLKVN